MAWNIDSTRRVLMVVLLLVNLFAPLQKVLACVAFGGEPMPMTMACCPEPLSLGDERYAELERQIVSGDSCCVIAINATAQDVSTQHQDYAQATLKQISELPWQCLPMFFLLHDTFTLAGLSVDPPAIDALAALYGSDTYAATARLRL